MVSLSNNTQGNVNITTKNGTGVNLNSNNDTDINANMNGNAQRAKSWAVGEGLIDGVDYSAKYYAGQAKESEEIASHAIENIDTAKDEAIAEMETTKEEKIGEIEETAAGFEDDLEALTTRAETAATNAETSETNAAASATRAESEATTAYTSASAANFSKNAAAASATSAESYKNAAETYRNQANQYRDDAQNYARQASGSANTASSKAEVAKSYAQGAATASGRAEQAKDAAEGYAEQAEAAKDDIEAELDNYVPNTRKVNNKPLSTDITLTSSDVGALANSTKYGYSIELSLDTTNYKLTLTLKDQDGTALSTKTVDFPIESVVVNGSYDSTNKKIVLTLQSGSTIDIPVGDLISGLQTEITSTNKLDSDLVDDTNSSHKFVTAAQLSQIATNTSDISSINANYLTTNTAQDVSERKTFLGEKAIYFKQSATTNKLGFTLYNPNSTELGAFEWRPSTIGSGALLNINVPYSSSNYVGFRYWGTAVNIVAPKVATAGNYYIPTHITNGNTTVTASNVGTVNISTLLPDVSNFVTNTSLATTLADYTLSSNLATVATSGSYNDLADKPYIPSGVVVDQTYDGTSTNAQSGIGIQNELSTNYQSKLVSRTNIKTINNTSILGSGNIDTNEIFVAEYNVTTFQQVLNAYSAGKTIVCKLSGFRCLTITYSPTFSYFVFSGVLTDNLSDIKNLLLYYIILNSSDNWSIVQKQLADTDLSNLSTTGQALIDGQWVLGLNYTLSSATAIGTYTCDLTSYLPSGNDKYEVLLDCQILATNNTFVSIKDSTYDNYAFCATSGGRPARNIIAIALTGKTFKYVIAGAALSSGYIRLRGYRRIGTNT